MSKKPNVIDLDTTPSPAVISPSLQNRAIYIPAIPANRAVAGSAVLTANIRVQKGSIPSAGQPVLSARSSKTVTRVSYRTMVSLFIISYHFKSYQDETDDIRTYGTIHRESKWFIYCVIIYFD